MSSPRAYIDSEYLIGNEAACTVSLILSHRVHSLEELWKETHETTSWIDQGDQLWPFLFLPGTSTGPQGTLPSSRARSRCELLGPIRSYHGSYPRVEQEPGSHRYDFAGGLNVDKHQASYEVISLDTTPTV